MFLQVTPYGPAYNDGQITEGDRIVSINGVNTTDVRSADAIKALMATRDDDVKMVVVAYEVSIFAAACQKSWPCRFFRVFPNWKQNCCNL